jgi:hypothetical protein
MERKDSVVLVARIQLVITHQLMKDHQQHAMSARVSCHIFAVNAGFRCRTLLLLYAAYA